jgi:hypothetical protein
MPQPIRPTASRGDASRRRPQRTEAEQGTRKVEQPLQEVSASLVADHEPANSQEPGQRPFHHPAVPAQSLAGLDAAPRNARGDATSTQRSPQVGIVVALVGVQLGRAFPRSPRFAAGTDDRGNGVDQGQQLGRIVGIGCGQPHGERNAVAVDDQMVLGTGFAPIGRVGAGRLTPFFARTLMLSTLARLQSMVAWSPSQFNSRSCSLAHTPAVCQSRSRRQQVEPLPQPSSRGSSCQEMPVLRTKMIPAKQARSGIRGRPPLGLGGAFGRKGTMASQRSSETSVSCFMGRRMPHPAGY